MKITSHLKYIEWRDTKGLHEDIMNAVSDLEFMYDELQFLTYLVAEYTLDLIHGKSFEESKRIAIRLSEHNTTGTRLLKLIKIHRNHLQILMDDVEVPNELRSYKDEHYKLLIEIMNFHSEVKKTKRNIYEMLSDTMKKSKQKKLL